MPAVGSGVGMCETRLGVLCLMDGSLYLLCSSATSDKI